MSTPYRIQRLLQAGHLDEADTSSGDLAALWQKAVTSARDARNPTTSPDNRYVLGYQALLQMSTAVLACAGYRTRGAQGHHANTFYAVAALDIPGLEEINISTERIRLMRKVSAYEAGSPAPEQLVRLNELLDDVMPRAHEWLVEQRRGVTFASYER
jgi:hypothetical protein